MIYLTIFLALIVLIHDDVYINALKQSVLCADISS